MMSALLDACYRLNYTYYIYILIIFLFSISLLDCDYLTLHVKYGMLALSIYIQSFNSRIYTRLNP